MLAEHTLSVFLCACFFVCFWGLLVLYFIQKLRDLVAF